MSCRFPEAISDGFWLFLKPLYLGKHKLEFIGEKFEFYKLKEYENITDDDIKDLPKFRVEVTYHGRWSPTDTKISLIVDLVTIPYM